MIMAPNPWMIAPFIALLLAIAVMPFINRHWWERNYPYVSIGLALIVALYYVFGLKEPSRLLHTGIEYLSFISLIGSLFVVAGGILIRIKGKSTPLANVVLLGIGAVISNIVGTTGASMILIRPYLRVNKYRVKPYHVVFFIFIVSNLGGALTPIGDPPLLLGYLRGVPFFWVAEHLWYKWLIVLAGILFVFYIIDRMSFSNISEMLQEKIEEEGEQGEVAGGVNALFLCIVVGAVFVTDPPFLREAIMITATVASYLTTKKDIHAKNEFNFLPIKEVAILFAGIFVTMIPALDWLQLNSRAIGITTVGEFYWMTGVLSALLDNAPTYLNFLSAAVGLFVNTEIVLEVQHLIESRGSDIAQIMGGHAGEVKATFLTLQRYHNDLILTGKVSLDQINIAYLIGNHNEYLQAISISAVFFGAMTYIGNGPNFMVKSIAEQAGVKCPSFFEYIVKYSLPFLLPLFAIVWLLFFLA